MITGFNKKLDLPFDPNNCKVYELKESYENSTLNYPALNKKAIIDFLIAYLVIVISDHLI
jgi:hypothetical protein